MVMFCVTEIEPSTWDRPRGGEGKVMCVLM